MVNIEGKLRQRWADKFYESNATKLLKSDEANFSERQKFTQEVDQFFQRCLSYLLNTLTAKQTFEKLSFGPSKANCLFMFILTQNHVLS